jgi:putative phosphoribosyl transferase
VVSASRDNRIIVKTVDDAVSRQLRVPGGRVELDGSLTVADDPIGVVLFAHGGGDSRYTPQDAYVARVLHEERISTLVFHLLTPHEEALDFATREHRFDLRVLAHRLVAITDWLRDRREFEDASIGYFSASTATGAALMAAAELGRHVAAVVSRSGRPDLAGEALARVGAPTLLIVGSNDRALIELNELASERLNAANELAIVPGASHAFDEPGAVAMAAGLASRWFVRHLPAPLTAK